MRPAETWARRQGPARWRWPLAVLVALGLWACAGPPLPGTDPAVAEERFLAGRRLFESAGTAACPDAAPLFHAACADVRFCAEALPFIADCFTVAETPELGVRFYDALIERFPDSAATVRGFRAVALERSGEVGAALAEYDLALAEQPNVKLAARYGRLLERIGRTEEALAVARSALAASPEDSSLMLIEARTLRRLGRAEEARERLDALLMRNPRFASGWVERGKLYALAGERERAIQVWQRAIALERTNLDARFMLAKDAWRDGRRGEFDRLLDEVRAIEATLGRGPRER